MTKDDQSTVNLTINTRLPSLFVDDIRVCVRNDGLALINFFADLPEGEVRADQGCCYGTTAQVIHRRDVQTCRLLPRGARGKRRGQEKEEVSVRTRHAMFRRRK